jgi:hypothetical protein
LEFGLALLCIGRSVLLNELPAVKVNDSLERYAWGLENWSVFCALNDFLHFYTHYFFPNRDERELEQLGEREASPSRKKHVLNSLFEIISAYIVNCPEVISSELANYPSSSYLGFK